MYGTLQAIGNLDIDTIDRYQAVKRKAAKTIQKCNKLLDATGRGADSGSEKSKKSSKKDSMSGQDNLVSPTSSKRKGPMVLIEGFGVHPDSGERGREWEELIRTVKEIKGKGEMTSKQNLRGPTFCLREESNYFETGWNDWSSLVISMTLEAEICHGIIAMLIYLMKVVNL